MFKCVATTIFRSATCRFVLVASILLPFSFKASPASACTASPMMATMCPFAGNFAPRGFAFAEGQLLAIAQFQALFSLLGTTYGGDGRTTFALPDLRGRFVIGPGHGPGLSSYNPGQKGGRQSVTLTTQQMPAHNHAAIVTIVGTNEPGDATAPEGAILGQDERDSNYYTGTASNTVNLSPDAAVANIGSTGGSQPVDTRPPYLAIRWIIALEGIYPSRN